MYFPRRYRRKLLLPPGLLALGFLLLLGCMRIAPDSRLKPYGVIQLNMPALFPEQSVPSYMKEWLPYQSQNYIDKFRDWDVVQLTGNLLHDSLSLIQAETLITDYQHDTLHARGLRIQLYSKTRYTSLVRAIDLMYIHNMKKFWLDIQHHPTTLYVFTDKLTLANAVPIASVCGGGIRIPALLEPLPFWQWLENWVTAFQAPKTWQPLADPAWRNSLYLLLLLSLVSIWKMARPSLH